MITRLANSRLVQSVLLTATTAVALAAGACSRGDVETKKGRPNVSQSSSGPAAAGPRVDADECATDIPKLVTNGQDVYEALACDDMTGDATAEGRRVAPKGNWCAPYDAQIGGSKGKKGWRVPQNLSVDPDNGVMRLVAFGNEGAGICFQPSAGQGIKEGVFSARFRIAADNPLTRSSGYNVVIGSWSATGEWSREVDAVEARVNMAGTELFGEVNAHHNDVPKNADSSVSKAMKAADFGAGGWHTITWSVKADALQFWLDGQSIKREDGSTTWRSPKYTDSSTKGQHLFFQIDPYTPDAPKTLDGTRQRPQMTLEITGVAIYGPPTAVLGADAATTALPASQLMLA